MRVFRALFETLYIGFLLKHCLIFGLEARLEEWFLNAVGYYMLSGLLGIVVFFLVKNSLIYKFFEERENARLNKKD